MESPEPLGRLNKGSSKIRVDIPDSEIMQMLRQGMSQWDVADHFGCARETICHRVKGMREGK